MEENFDKNGSSDQVVQETVLSTRKSKKIRKIIGQVVLTVVLACVFGLVAGVVFVKTDSTLLKRLGLKIVPEQETEKARVVLDKEEANASGGMTVSAETQNTAGNVNNQADKESGKPAEIQHDSVDRPKTVTDENSPEDIDDSENAAVVLNTAEADGTRPGEAKEGEEEAEEQPVTPADIAKAAEHYLFCVTGSTKNMNWLDEQITTSASYPGVFLADNGVELLILANYSDFLEYENLSVTIRNDKTYGARPYAFDKDFDMLILAVSKADVDEGDLEFIEPALIANSAVPTTGTPIVALGSPNGYFGSLLTGFVSSSGSIYPVMDGTVTLFNTDIVDNEYGRGIVLSYDGELLGLISRKMRTGLNEYMNTCIWANGAKLVLEHLLNDQPIASVGIMVKDMPESVLADMQIINGIYITEVVGGSPAEEAGLRRGYVLTSMNDVAISNIAQFDRILWRYDEGQEIKVKLFNPIKNEEQEVTLTAGKR